VISTVDPQARHTRKSPRNRKDGYRAHMVAEPETGLITDEALTMAAGPENSDAAVAQQFLTPSEQVPAEQVPAEQVLTASQDVPIAEGRDAPASGGDAAGGDAAGGDAAGGDAAGGDAAGGDAAGGDAAGPGRAGVGVSPGTATRPMAPVSCVG
jgi:hypothetical protein